jgi:hypothetical protein
VFLKTLS